ncbi:uncharacterized protein LOC108681877 isoform X3 [Hyalella azteca]|uniref:Uncharacterized protein LOC108681877 isoform X3 n=1 Tax=Hyalella azteca TaxID=294128 RepID=A0A979FGF5_HYAAZ|nr:uncharacterized protein LOC108681877 isoform X3 [Hyalella azteca]
MKNQSCYQACNRPGRGGQVSHPSTSVPPSSHPVTLVILSSRPSTSGLPSSNPSISILPTSHPSTSNLPSSHPVTLVILSSHPSTSVLHPSNPSTSVLPASHPSTSVLPSSHPSTSVLPSSHPSTSVLPSYYSTSPMFSSHSTSVTPSLHSSTSVTSSSHSLTSVMSSSHSSTSVTPSSHSSTSVMPSSHSSTSVMPSSHSSTSVTPSSHSSTSVMSSSHSSTSVTPSSHSSTSVMPSSTSVTPSLHSSTSVTSSSHSSSSVMPSSHSSTSVTPSSHSSTPVMLLSCTSTSLRPASFTCSNRQEPPMSLISSTFPAPYCLTSHSPCASKMSPTSPLLASVAHDRPTECNAANNNIKGDAEMGDIDVKDESFSYDDKAHVPCSSGAACPSSLFPPPPPPLVCWRPCKTEAQIADLCAQRVLFSHFPDPGSLEAPDDMESSSASSKGAPVGLNESMQFEDSELNLNSTPLASNRADWLDPWLASWEKNSNSHGELAEKLQITSKANVKTMLSNRLEVPELSPAHKTPKRRGEETGKSSDARSSHQLSGFSSPTKTTPVLGQKTEFLAEKYFEQSFGSHFIYGLKKFVLQMKTRKLLNLALERPNSNGPSPKRPRVEEVAACAPCEARTAYRCCPKKAIQNRQQATVCLVPSCGIETQHIQQHYQEHHELPVVCAEQLTKLGKDFEELDKTAEHTLVLTPEEIHEELENSLTEVMAIDQTAINALTGQLRTFVDLFTAFQKTKNDAAEGFSAITTPSYRDNRNEIILKNKSNPSRGFSAITTFPNSDNRSQNILENRNNPSRGLSAITVSSDRNNRSENVVESRSNSSRGLSAIKISSNRNNRIENIFKNRNNSSQGLAAITISSSSNSRSGNVLENRNNSSRGLSAQKASLNRDSRRDVCELVEAPPFENQQSAQDLRPRESSLNRYVALCPMCEVPFVSSYMMKHFIWGHQIRNLDCIARFYAVAQSKEKLILLTRVPKMPYRTADCVREEDLALLRNESKLVSTTGGLRILGENNVRNKAQKLDLLDKNNNAGNQTENYGDDFNKETSDALAFVQGQTIFPT